MGDLVSIQTLAGNFKTFAELQEYCDAQFVSLKKANEKMKKLEDEVEHLKGLLGSTASILPEVKPVLNVPAEQAICELQINQLRDEAMKRPLTLEETKRLDLLVKNLYLSRGQATNISKSTFTGNISDAELMDIASGPERHGDE